MRKFLLPTYESSGVCSLLEFFFLYYSRFHNRPPSSSDCYGRCRTRVHFASCCVPHKSQPQAASVVIHSVPSGLGVEYEAKLPLDRELTAALASRQFEHPIRCGRVPSNTASPKHLTRKINGPKGVHSFFFSLLFLRL